MTEPLDQETAVPERAPELLVGEKLRAAREARGLSIQELAKSLCLGSRQIEALEKGELDKLPGKTFIRGVVRNYAGIARLDADPLLALLDRIKNLETPTLALPESTHVIMPDAHKTASGSRSGLILAGILLVVIAAALYFFAPSLDLRDLQGDARQDAPPLDPPLSLPLPENIPPAPSSLTAPSPEAASSEPTPPVTPPSAPSDTPEGQRTLQFVFSGDAWVEVRDKDNRVLVSGRFSAEQTQSVSGWPPFSVTVGDVAQTRLYDNGMEVPLKASGETRSTRVQLP